MVTLLCILLFYITIELLLVNGFISTNSAHPICENGDEDIPGPLNANPGHEKNDVLKGSGASRKRQNAAPVSPLPKRGKLNDAEETRLSNDTRALSVNDKIEKKDNVAAGDRPCVVRFHLPCENGSRTQTAEFTLTTKLSELFSYISADGFDPVVHLFILSYPRRVYSIEDEEKTLEELGFTKSEVVHVDRIC
ncbi:UBX domain protein [Cooperia oncophora]